jgi:hypothetical protein
MWRGSAAVLTSRSSFSSTNFRSGGSAPASPQYSANVAPSSGKGWSKVAMEVFVSSSSAGLTHLSHTAVMDRRGPRTRSTTSSTAAAAESASNRAANDGPRPASGSVTENVPSACSSTVTSRLAPTGASSVAAVRIGLRDVSIAAR